MVSSPAELADGTFSSPLTCPGAAEACAELVLAYLAGRVARQLIDQLELFGDLLPHDAPPFHERAHRGKRQCRRPGPRHDAGAHALAARRVRHADHRHVGDGGMCRQLVLDALGREVLALADDDVLLAAGDADVALGVAHGEVAGAEEAVGREGRVQLGVEVTHAELCAVGFDLALDAGTDLASRLVDQARHGVGHGSTIGTVALVGRIGRHAAGEERALGHAVRPVGMAAEALADGADELGGHVGRAGAAAPHAAHLRGREVGRGQHRLHHRGRAAGAGHAVALDQIERQRRVEPVHHHRARADGERLRHEEGDAAAVRQRELDQAAVVGGRRREPPLRVHHGAERRRGMEHALRIRGRPRRVEEHRDVVRAVRRRRQRRRGIVLEHLERALPRGRIRPYRQHVLEVGCVGTHRLGERTMIDAAHDPRHDQHACARLAAEEGHLTLAIDRDDRVRDGAQAIDRDCQRRRLDPVRELPGDDVARTHPETAERHGHAIGAAGEVAKGPFPTPVALALDQIDAVRRLADARGEQRRERQLRPRARRLVARAPIVGRAGRLHAYPAYPRAPRAGKLPARDAAPTQKRYARAMRSMPLALVLLLSRAALAENPPPLFAGLGTHHFPVTTRSAKAQAYMDQGIALVYGFNHEEAIRAFREAARLDPGCAMAHWGVALALGPNYNMTLDDERAVAARHAVDAALARAPGTTPREQAYIRALARRYGRSPTTDDRQALDRAYADAMRDVMKRYPDDLDAATLFAESLMVLRPWDLWTLDGTPQPGTEEIVATLEAVLARDPGHPGANHYLIHALEASPHPERALRAADTVSA